MKKTVIHSKVSKLSMDKFIAYLSELSNMLLK